jgi:hypothetical protein
MSTQNPDFLNMSDEDIMNFDPSKIPTEDTSKKEDDTEVVTDPVDPVEPVDPPKEDNLTGDSDPENKVDDEDDDIPVENSDPGKQKDTNTQSTEAKQDEQAKPETKDPKVQDPAADSTKVETNKTETVDYKAVCDKLFTPFKANGKEIAISNVDDAISLMQMGANYNKRMAALKPNLKLLKLLENNDLLQEDKLGFLIDLHNKNPEAIKKLMQDSKIDPMDLAGETNEYKPQKHVISDSQIELDNVIGDIQDSPTFQKTIDVVVKQWDSTSRRIVGDHPEILKTIDSHMQIGIYDMIMTEIEKERMFGRLKGLSDIEAYRQVGDAIEARGGFNSLAQKENSPVETTVVTPKPKVEDDPKLKEKKRAASSSKPSITQAKPDFNPLALSDEEFAKLGNPKFL